jgi:septal ring factor EnvC (AmiA/AmiB activator)
LAKLQEQSVASAKIAQDNEAQLTELETRVAALAEQEKTQQAELDAQQEHERQVLAGLQRLARNPPSAILLSPGQPLDLARGAMLLGAVAPRLEAEARQIAAALDQLHKTEGEIASERAEIAEHQAALDTERQRLSDLLAAKQALQGETQARAQAAQQSLAALTAQAGDLRELVVKVEHERDRKQQEEDAKGRTEREARAEEAKPARDVAKQMAAEAQATRLGAPGTRDKSAATPAAASGLAPHEPRILELGKTALLMPAAGEISRHFGDPDGFSTSKGLSFKTRAAAQVVAPFDGQVMFAGPFKGYGQILIIDHGGGYHSLLAGMDQVSASVGQSVIAGEPVGVMPAEANPSLYLELRRQGQPINPLPWLAARDGRASG